MPRAHDDDFDDRRRFDDEDDDERTRRRKPAGTPVGLIVALAVGLGLLGLGVLAAFFLGAEQPAPPPMPMEVPLPMPGQKGMQVGPTVEALPAGQQLLTIQTVNRGHGRDGVTLEVGYALAGAEVTENVWVVLKKPPGATSRLPVRKGFKKSEVPGMLMNAGTVSLREGVWGDGFAGPFDVWVETGGDETEPGQRVSNVHHFR